MTSKGITNWSNIKDEMLAASERVLIKNPSYLDGNPPFANPMSKYVRNASAHIKRIKAKYDLLDIKNKSRVFEIGPGVGYFLYICRELSNCKVIGVDLRFEDVYLDMINELSIRDEVKLQTINSMNVINFYNTKYDYIVALGGSFIRGWELKDHKFFIKNCMDNLLADGKILLQFNADKVTDEVLEFYNKISNNGTNNDPKYAHYNKFLFIIDKTDNI